MYNNIIHIYISESVVTLLILKKAYVNLMVENDLFQIIKGSIPKVKGNENERKR